MSLVADDIYGAIYKKFTDTAALNTLTDSTTSMEFFADKGFDMPYIVVSIVSMVPKYHLGQLTTPWETSRVQFSVLDDTSSSKATITAILDQIEAAYGVNGTALSFEDSTYTHDISRRILGPLLTHIDGVWQATIDYQMRFNKAA